MRMRRPSLVLAVVVVHVGLRRRVDVVVPYRCGNGCEEDTHTRTIPCPLMWRHLATRTA